MTEKATQPTAAEDVDLDQFEDLTVSTIVIKNPLTGAPTTNTISIAGPEHPARKKAMLDRSRKLRAEAQRTGRQLVTDPLEDIDVETALMVAFTLGWSLKIGGSAVAYSVEAARTLYCDPKRQWLRAQVKRAIDETDRFIGSSQTA